MAILMFLLGYVWAHMGKRALVTPAGTRQSISVIENENHKMCSPI